MSDMDVRSSPLLHEDKQVGFLVSCPDCGADMRVPVFELLMAQPEDSWSVPPQNTALAEGGWYNAWGSEATPARLSLRFPVATRGDATPGNPAVISCTDGCGKAYTIVDGQIDERP